MLRLGFVLLCAMFAPPAFAAADDNAPSAGSPDNKRSAVGDGQTIKIFDVATGKELIRIQAHTAKVTALAFSPDGKLLASGSDDKTVRIFDPAAGRALVVLKGHDAGIIQVAFSVDGKTLTSVDKNQKAVRWDPASGKQLP